MRIRMVELFAGIGPQPLADWDVQPRILIRNATRQGFLEASEGDSIDLEGRANRSPTVRPGSVPSLKTSPTIGALQHGRIRRLTPRECWRAMDFTDGDYDRAKALGTSETQLYRQAGNSICVGVLVAIFREIYHPSEKTVRTISLENWS